MHFLLSNNAWPEFDVLCFSRILFCWMNKLLWKGFKKPLDFPDLWTIDPNDDAKNVCNKFEGNLRKRLNMKYHKMIKAEDGLIMNFLKSPDPDWHGYLYVAFLIIGQILKSVFYQHQNQKMYRICIRLKAGIMACIFRKSLMLNSESRNENAMGKIMNLLSVDVTKFTETASYIHLVWASVLQIIVGFVGLYLIIGFTFVPGLIVYVIMFVMNSLAATYIQLYQERQMNRKDERLKLLGEIFSGIKVIKLYAWENAFINNVAKIRNREISCIKSLAKWNGATEVSWSCTNLLACLSIFASYIFVSDEKRLTAENAFTVITVLNVLYVPLSMLPTAFSTMSAFFVSIRRIEQFLIAEELKDYTELNEHSNYSVEFRTATFSYAKEKPPSLYNLNLAIKKGSLIGIVGPVGAGKSTFLKAILGETNKVSGRILVNGSTAYVPQEAWLQNLTVQENILFAKKFNKEKYNKVILACSLIEDFKNLVAGDQSELGEAGLNLSGGQKQRINLARAVYQNCDIYLLDAPLSAVDATVGKHIFENVISNRGLLQKRISSNRDNFLCKVTASIEFSAVESPYHQKGEEIRLLTRELTSYVNSGWDYGSGSATQSHNAHITRAHLKIVAIVEGANRKTRIIVTHGLGNLHECELVVYLKDGVIECMGSFGHIIRRSASFREFIADYLKQIDDKELQDIDNKELTTLRESPVTLDALVKKSVPINIFGQNIFLLLIVFTIFYVAALVIFQASAATILHANLIQSLFKCPMKFFDSVPVGRIMNRCGKDIDVIDNRLPMVMSNVVYFVSLFAVSFLVELYVTPFYIIPFIPILACYFSIQVFYVRSSRQLRRLESISRSPIYSFLQESIAGSSIIRPFKQTNRFCHQFDQLINVNSVVQLTLASTNGWLGIYLDIIGASMVGAAALLGVIQRSNLMKGSVGLSLVTMLMMTELLQWGVKEIGLLETEAVALERIAEYVKAEHEAEWSNILGARLKEWPSCGSIQFKNYSTSYRAGAPLVIKNLTCKIDGGQKIGIVGRTGAGKSSITVAIFRLIEATEGKIFIDNVDISLLGLHDLRKKLTIIPQDPVLFSGTLRSNIDPFNEFADDQLWSIIEISKMKKKVEGFQDKLNFKISECGQNMRLVLC
uniref:Uncharacterized protein n=1 Tax=Romanomermis culicivorax TaxID=13658 RepID=A0A915JQ44_ROMCU